MRDKNEIYCGFCGSAMGNSKNFKEQAQALGESIANRGITLVYGGGRAGLMGVVADSALNAGGTVIGVIPQNLVDAELAHPLLTELHVVKNMHERKTKCLIWQMRLLPCRAGGDFRRNF